jgi:hypothetical protein
VSQEAEDRRIAICTLADDFHAYVIQNALRTVHQTPCVVVATDRLSGSPSLSWSNDGFCPPTVQAISGEQIDVRQLDLIWWRRGNVTPRLPAGIADPAHSTLIRNDCHAGLLGLLLNEFRGVWISDPLATHRAQNKLVQLRAAEAAGFRTPKTLVSQDPERIRAFCASLDNRVIVKTVRGAANVPILTKMLDPCILAADDSLELSPATYQELIEGRRHVRAALFGDAVYAAMIESEALDWRIDLRVPVTRVELGEEVAARLRLVLNLLGLKMGVVDLKLDESGEPVWLEVNPQGQFLFLEGLCGLELTAGFSDFLQREAQPRSGSPGRDTERVP